MEKKSFKELREQKNSVNEKLGNLYVKAANRELTAEEKIEEMNLTRELNVLNEQIRDAKADAEFNAATAGREKVNLGAAFREHVQNVRAGKAEREILLNPAGGNVTANIAASGAINLTIKEMIPTLHEGLGLPGDLKIVTGVEGNEIWPVSVNDVEMEETGEAVELQDQVLDFAKITPTPRRVGLTVPVSNMAIDNAAFDLLAFVQAKFTIALRKYLAKKIYSQAQFQGNKGPFAGLASSGTINIASGAYAAILRAVAQFSDKGFFEGNVTLVMDRETEALLKATPKLAGAAEGFIVEDGLCAGYPYVVTHYLNTKLASDNKSLEPTTDKYIGIGYFEWFALQQHGQVRLSVDNVSISVARKNITAITLNTAWSMTDLSTHINGGAPTGDTSAPTYPTQAFALYKVVEEAETTTEDTSTEETTTE